MMHNKPLNIRNIPLSSAELFLISARVLAHQPLAVLAEDDNRTVRIVNPAFCSLFQLREKPEDLAGTDCRKLTATAKLLLKEEDHFIERIDEILENKVPVRSAEFELKDGRHLNVEYEPCFEFDSFLGHIWCFTDITERRKAEQKLQLSEYKYRRLLDQLNEVVFQMGHSREIVFLNPAWKNTLGYETGACLGKLLTSFVIPGDRELMTDTITEVITGETLTVSKTIGFTAKDGRTKWISVYLAKAQLFTHLTLWGTLTDVTEQRIAEQGLLSTLRREKELNELKSNFVNMVSHEFRTPLAGILSSIELLELIGSRSTEPLKPDTVHYYERIKSQVSRMTGLMNNVLLLSRIETGNIEFKPTETNLPALCREMIDQTVYPGDARKIGMTVKGRERMVRLDVGMLRHILVNLMTNALKYSPKGTDPELKLVFGNTHVTLRVTDSGIGIPAPERKKLFHSFFRASNTGTIEGTGLGLVVVKYFVERHRGAIGVQSRPGKGSVFKVTFPYN